MIKFTNQEYPQKVFAFVLHPSGCLSTLVFLVQNETAHSLAKQIYKIQNLYSK